jgi:hypothetical protein
MNVFRSVAFLLTAALLAVTQTYLEAASGQEKSPWNGDWVLSPTRNTNSARESAAEGYRFHISADGSIRWEIPTLHEVVEGRTNGQPMEIHRRGANGMTLAVTTEGAWILHYVVAKDGKPVGEGRMTIVEEGRAWVDITQPFGRPDLAHVVIYERAPTPNKQMQ